MKYDSQLIELKNLLPSAKSILIALPSNCDMDRFAAGLALFLSFNAQGKEVSVVCDDTIHVAQSHLFGVNHVQKNIPQTQGGNFVISLEGVAVPNSSSPQGGQAPALEKMDYVVEGNNLNLVFYILPGQTFQPSRIVPHYQGSGFNLIFTIGAANLNHLGNIYLQNQGAFSGVHVVNIDIQAANTSFGQTNVVDSAASSVAEIMTDVVGALGLPFDADIASNLLAGIFEATSNLTSQNVSADTHLAVANCLRIGGRKPEVLQNAIPASGGFDLSSLISPKPTVEAFTAPPISSEPQPSPEERPSGEGLAAESIEPEPGWLTPKVFKGGSVG
ncbi:hypothetical protein HY386_01035 [Candidatus Daviesbacteria bacterium]|nr:hypothetical protein [Candidatus Daviesbacteria bacterium]